MIASENANLLAMAADALGAACAPLICTDGMPATAQRALLSQPAAAGASLRHHGDFERPGIAIGNRVLQASAGARSSRFTAVDYATAVRLAEAEAKAPLHGRPVAACWEAGLAAATAAAQCAVAEEALLKVLPPDLAAGGRR